MRRRLTTVAVAACVLAATASAALAVDRYVLRESPEMIEAYDGQKSPNVATSEHFAIWWGDQNPKNYQLDDKSIKAALENLEQVRGFYVNTLKYPMAQAEKAKCKVNVYLTETGLKGFEHGWAFGSADSQGFGLLAGEPAIMTPGHNGAAHEFAHAMQFESQGFRDSDYVGWFWECHAQFMAHQITYATDMPHVLDYFTDTAQFDIRSTRHHYGAWIFLQYLAERPGYGFGFVNSLWLKPSLTRDEDPIAKLVRFASMKNPTTDWADMFGDFAKRNVSFGTYKRGASYLKALQKAPERTTSRSRTPLEPIKERPGWYRIPYAFAPQQNGYNVIPLFPQSKTVSVTFSGLVDPVRKPDWRVTLVAVDDNGKDRFSKTWNSGAQSITLRPNENELYLVVAATPGVLVPQSYDPNFIKQDRFPYEVKITGAMPNGAERPQTMLDTVGSAHPNGGGFVAATAKVDSAAYVGPKARVLGNAQVLNNARVEDYAVISGDAVISGSAIVSGNAYVTDNATVSGNARIRDYARLYDTASVEGNARIFEFPKLQKATHVSGNAVVRGHAIVGGADISGTALITGGADPGAGIKCHKGVFTSFVYQGDCDKATDNGGLFAAYTFNSPHAFLVRDDFAAGDAFIHGNPAWTPGYIGYLGFNGNDQYIELPNYLCDLRDSRIEMKVKWLGTKPGERAFDFGRDKDNCIYLTPMSDTGKAQLVMIVGGKKAIIESAEPFAMGDWYKVTITFAGDNMTLSLNDVAVGTTTSPGRLEDLKADSNYLAKGRDGSFFTGQFDSLMFRIQD